MALAVSHGGLGGIYEAIQHAVPMVVIPFVSDHYGNAARVVQARLGVRLGKDSLANS